MDKQYVKKAIKINMLWGWREIDREKQRDSDMWRWGRGRVEVTWHW